MRTQPGQCMVLLDIGHGPYNSDVSNRPPYDPGAISPVGWHEFHVNCITAITALERLQTLGHYVTFVPLGLGLIERGMMARGFDVFVSIHHNASGSGRAQGSEVAVHTLHATHADKTLGFLVAKTLSEALRIADRGIVEMRLAVLTGARKTNVKAAIATEGYFMDQDGVDLVSWARLEGLALAGAIDTWLRSPARKKNLS